MAEPVGVFISYRRGDSPAHAGRLFDRISDRFGEQFVFMDVDSIELGADFYEAIDNALARCKVLLAIIGPRWLEATDEHGRQRLADPRDFVRHEIATALRRRIRVIPVLIDGAALPRKDQLPADLVELTNRQTVEVSHAQFRSDSHRLVEGVARIIGQPGAVLGAAEATPDARPAGDLPVRSGAWSATLVKSGWTRVFDVGLTHEHHSLEIKNGMRAYTVNLDGKVVFHRVTREQEMETTFAMSDGSEIRRADLWAQISFVLATFKKTRLAIDGVVIYAD